jgi:hypothetical protein
MAAIIAYCLSGAIALSILLIAARLLFVPHMAAAGFGVAVRPDPRWDACPSTKVVSRHRIRSVHRDPDSQSGWSLAWLVHACSDKHLACRRRNRLPGRPDKGRRLWRSWRNRSSDADHQWLSLAWLIALREIAGRVRQLLGNGE